MSQDLPLPIDYLYRGLWLNPDAIAAEDDRERISYRELVRRAEALATGLRQQLPAGSRVALCAQNHIGHLNAFLAILAGGFIWIPINPKNGQALNRALLAKSQPALILVDQASLSAIDATDPRLLFLDGDRHPTTAELIAAHDDAPFVAARPETDAIMGIKFTGGTTGEPKGVMQSHGNVAAVVENMQACFEFQADDTNLAVAPLTHGGSHYILPLLAVGGRHLLLRQPRTEDIIDAFHRRGASVSFMPPTLIYKLLEQPEINRESFPRLRHLTYSAAPMPPERIAQVIERLGPKLSTVYGQTEAPMSITAMNSEEMRRPELQRSVGKACHHSQIAILDSSGEVLPPGESGEIAVRGNIVMSGYFQESTKTRQTFRNGWLLTGDLGYLNTEGYLFLQGRSTELIISGGFNIYPAEVENALMSLPGIRECAVFGTQDNYWGERVEAAVCLAAEHPWQEPDLRQQLKALLGAVKTPKRIHFVDRLPRNPVGKVVRREVKALIEQQLANDRSKEPSP